MNVPETSTSEAEMSVCVRRHTMEVVERIGYREFRCEPSSWTYAAPSPYRELLAEFYCARMGVDRHGDGTDRNFWSGSDAALRMCAIPPADLALREISVLATSRSVGLNAPEPWFAKQWVASAAAAWELEASDIHWTQQAAPEPTRNLWAHYGMERVLHAPVITGNYMTGAVGAPVIDVTGLRSGGPGTYHSWAAVVSWDRWPRRQDMSEASDLGERPGMLRLFVSHRWDSASHPDPHGRPIQALNVGLTLALACALRLEGPLDDKRTESGLPEILAAHLELQEPGCRDDGALLAWADAVSDAARAGSDEVTLWPILRAREGPAVAHALERLRSSVGIWYDFASMYQSPRTANEQEHFESEILCLNEIQASACTVLLAGGDDYVRRAWCFLELCGGMRGVVTELTPTWCNSVKRSGSTTRWSSLGDQLIGALNVHGLDAIDSSGLQATKQEDLRVVAWLLSQLQLLGATETDDSDLVGGVMPMPYHDGAWTFARATEPDPLVTMQKPLSAPGRIAPGARMRDLARQSDALQGLSGAAGMWIYTTQRTLSLSWAARADEIWTMARTALSEMSALGWPEPLPDKVTSPVAVCWADARALADEGQGWTRIAPSRTQLLVIVTQSEIPKICRLYDRTLLTHLAAGVSVLTVTPADGKVKLHIPPGPTEIGFRAHVLAVRRLRRLDIHVDRQLLSPGAQPESVEVLAALRLEPSEGFVRTGGTVTPVLSESEVGPPYEITQKYLLSHCALRAHAEGFARCQTASWDSWGAPRLSKGAWEAGIAPVQLARFEGLVHRARPLSENPLQRRRLLEIVVKEDEGYALSEQRLEDMEALVRMALARETKAGGSSNGR